MCYCKGSSNITSNSTTSTNDTSSGETIGNPDTNGTEIEEEEQGKWILATHLDKELDTCDKACARTGSICDPIEQSKLATNEKVKSAVIKAGGGNCDSGDDSGDSAVMTAVA